MVLRQEAGPGEAAGAGVLSVCDTDAAAKASRALDAFSFC